MNCWDESAVRAKTVRSICLKRVNMYKKIRSSIKYLQSLHYMYYTIFQTKCGFKLQGYWLVEVFNCKVGIAVYCVYKRKREDYCVTAGGRRRWSYVRSRYRSVDFPLEYNNDNMVTVRIQHKTCFSCSPRGNLQHEMGKLHFYDTIHLLFSYFS